MVPQGAEWNLSLRSAFSNLHFINAFLIVIKRDLTPENSFSGCRPKVSEVLCTFSYLKKVPFFVFIIIFESWSSGGSKVPCNWCWLMYECFFQRHLIFGWLLNNILEICQNPLGATWKILPIKIFNFHFRKPNFRKITNLDKLDLIIVGFFFLLLQYRKCILGRFVLKNAD